MGRNKFLGEVRLHLSSMDLSNTENIKYTLKVLYHVLKALRDTVEQPLFLEVLNSTGEVLYIIILLYRITKMLRRLIILMESSALL